MAWRTSPGTWRAPCAEGPFPALGHGLWSHGLRLPVGLGAPLSPAGSPVTLRLGLVLEELGVQLGVVTTAVIMMFAELRLRAARGHQCSWAGLRAGVHRSPCESQEGLLLPEVEPEPPEAPREAAGSRSPRLPSSQPRPIGSGRRSGPASPAPEAEALGGQSRAALSKGQCDSGIHGEVEAGPSHRTGVGNPRQEGKGCVHRQNQGRAVGSVPCTRVLQVTTPARQRGGQAADIGPPGLVLWLFCWAGSSASWQPGPPSTDHAESGIDCVPLPAASAPLMTPGGLDEDPGARSPFPAPMAVA